MQVQEAFETVANYLAKTHADSYTLEGFKAILSRMSELETKKKKIWMGTVASIIENSIARNNLESSSDLESPSCPNHGERWTKKEILLLEEEIKSNMSVFEIARRHGRTFGAIGVKAERHHLIKDRKELRDWPDDNVPVTRK